VYLVTICTFSFEKCLFILFSPVFIRVSGLLVFNFLSSLRFLSINSLLDE
jgi:hypothetical protein